MWCTRRILQVRIFPFLFDLFISWDRFSSCADISIASHYTNVFASLPTTTTTAITSPTPWLLLPFINSKFHFPTIPPSSMLTYPAITQPPITTPILPTLIYPFQASNKLIDQADKTSKTVRCYPTNEALKPLLGIEHWCLQLCAINCPPALCICVKI